jgi:preprotein translocase subunit SecE
MPSVQEEKPMSSNLAASEAPEPEDDRPSTQPGQAKPVAGAGGFFTIYKKGQGKWTRLGTVFCAAFLGLLTTYTLYGYILQATVRSYAQGGSSSGAPVSHHNVIMGICAAFLAVYSLVVYWVMNKPTNADFLIATDSEMKKVNWTTKGELFGSTRVVILFLFFIAIFLFVADQFFQLFFYMINVLKIKPWFIG